MHELAKAQSSPPPSTVSLSSTDLVAIIGRQVSALAREKPDYDAVRREDLTALIRIGDVLARNEPCPIDEAVKGARTMMGCYRARDFLDPEVFTTALVGNLTRYPAVVVRLACCPIHGLPAKAKFPPAIAEIRDHLDDTLARLQSQARIAKKTETILNSQATAAA